MNMQPLSSSYPVSTYVSPGIVQSNAPGVVPMVQPVSQGLVQPVAQGLIQPVSQGLVQQVASGLVQQPITYMEEQRISQPIVREQQYQIERERPPKVYKNVYEMNSQKTKTFYQQPVYTMDNPIKYPVTYKISPPRIRMPRRVEEEVVVIKPPRKQMMKQQYVEQQDIILQRPVTHFVTNPVQEVVEYQTMTVYDQVPQVQNIIQYPAGVQQVQTLNQNQYQLGAAQIVGQEVLPAGQYQYSSSIVPGVTSVSQQVNPIIGNIPQPMNQFVGNIPQPMNQFVGNIPQQVNPLPGNIPQVRISPKPIQG